MLPSPGEKTRIQAIRFHEKLPKELWRVFYRPDCERLGKRQQLPPETSSGFPQTLHCPQALYFQGCRFPSPEMGTNPSAHLVEHNTVNVITTNGGRFSLLSWVFNQHVLCSLTLAVSIICLFAFISSYWDGILTSPFYQGLQYAK